MDYQYYRALKPNDVIPIQSDLSKAINLFAPHVAHITQARVVSARRAVVLSVHDEVAVKVNAPSTEAANLQYVLNRTSVPVPKLFGLYRGEDEGLNFLVMDFVQGEAAKFVWPSLSPQQKQRLVDRLKACFEELRAFSASCIAAANFDGLCSDFLDDKYAGPFRNEDELNDALVASLDDARNYYAPFVRKMLKSGHKIVFSHGDFDLRNFMIQDGELSAIIDWEFAGFYPEYWDYAVAHNSVVWYKPDYVDWKESIQRFLKPYPVEAATLKVMRNFALFGQ